MNFTERRFCLFSNCQLVKGYSKSIIYDIHRRKIFPIPNSFYILITKYKNKTVKQIKKIYNNKFDNIVDEYYDFLKQNELVLEVNNNEYSFFTELNLKWENPFLITNCIIQYKKYSILEVILKQLNIIGVNNIQIHVDDITDIQILIETCMLFQEIGIELFVKYSKELDIEKFKYCNNIAILCIHSAPDDARLEFPNIISATTVKQEILFDKSCGNVGQYYFTINYSLFFESQAHNTCLNRKLCIDADGNIKNCPAMERSFGNIKDTTLKEAIEKPGFKDLWYIHKDQIAVCKDCEFRHMCTDCRCFIKDPDNIYSQPAKCTYNPYVCKWEGEEGYVPVEECGTYNRNIGFVPDPEKIKALNKQIWGEDDE